MQIANRQQPHLVDRLRTLVLGFYTWAVTLAFGAVLIDIVYARQAPSAAASSAVADFLLLLSAVIVVAGMAAIVFSWRARSARFFFIASLLLIVLGFLIPALLTPLLEGAGLGTPLRIAVSGPASILAFIGLNSYYRASPERD